MNMSTCYLDMRCASTDSIETAATSSASSCSTTSTTVSKTYLFRSAVNTDSLDRVLSKVATPIDGGKWLQFDPCAFRKMVFHEFHKEFVASVKDYYYPAKWKKYGNKEITYNSFTTILRQLCNEVGRTFYTKHVYEHSICNTIYFISAPAPPLSLTM